MAEGNVMFPVFLKLEELDTLVVGGGNVGIEKLEALLKNSPKASITLVAGMIREEIEEIAQKNPHVKLVHRNFEWQDLENKDIVILATDQPELHAEIKAETRKRRILTNVADTPHLCDFYLCSTVKKGDLKIGISTNGKSPTLAKRMREFLESALPDNVQDLLDNLKEYRAQLAGDFQYKLKALNELTQKVLSNKQKNENTKP